MEPENQSLEQSVEQHTKKSRWWKKPTRFSIEVIKVVVISTLVIVPIRTWIVQPVYVQQVSMLPTLQQYDYLLVSRLSYRVGEPERGDIVVFEEEEDEPALIKRVVGLPGERVEVRDRNVYIDGVELDESAYLAESVETWGQVDMLVGEGAFFMMGDNRTHSKDSRYFGPVSREQFVGKTWLRLLPFSGIQTF